MNSNNRLFMDIHVIQTMPPSNINRDDTGSPKTAQYGGVRRSRVSSQSWKRAMREYFYTHSEQKNVGIRSLEIVNYVKKFIVELNSALSEEEALKKAAKVITDSGIKLSKDNKAKALFFMSEMQAKSLAKAAIDDNYDKSELKAKLKMNPAIDIALFGRMVADDPSLNEDASSQVAHAISTHAVQTEFDFFTAVDDLSPEDNAGAGMLGTVEYNSSTLYRYANVAVHELLKQLGNSEMTITTLKLFIESFANSLPTGKVNTFANQTLPQFIMVALRTDRPVNLVSAFEKPVKSNDGFVHQSIEQLAKEQKQVQKITKDPESLKYVILDDSIALDAGESMASISDLVNNIADDISLHLMEKKSES